MATDKRTPLEKRRDAQKEIAAIDLERAKAIKEIFERPELVTAREDLEALYDPDAAEGPMSAATNVNALIKSGLTILGNMAVHADGHIAAMEAVVNPPEPRVPAPLPPVE